MILSEILLFVALLALSAFFSGSETALFSLSKLQLKELEEGGAGKRVADLLAKPQQLLILILIGNTLVNTATAALATLITHSAAMQGGMSPRAAILLEIVVVTVVILMVSEVTPKVYAIRNGERWARSAAFPLQVCGMVLWPLVRPVMLLTRQVRKLIRGQDRLQLSSEELKALLEVGHEEGHLEEDEKKMIHSIFEFGETTVREVMVPRIDMVCLPNTAGVEEAVELIRREGHSRIPVFRDRVDNVTGILYAKDLIPHLRQDAELGTLDQLARLPYFVPEGKKIDELLHEFQTGRMHMAIVVDEYGGTAGLVTLEDILEEIVGEIQDEFDVEAPQHRRTDDGAWVIDSSVLLEDVNLLLEEEILPTDEDYETLGGFIYQLAGEVPRASSSYRHLDWRFTVMTMKRHRIGLVKAERVQVQEKMSEKGLRNRLARAYASTHLKYTREQEAVSFFEEVAKQGPLLVVMPRDASAFEAARSVLPYLRWFTSGEDDPIRVHAFLHETFKTWIDSRLISSSVAWNDKDLNLLKLPGNRLLNRVAALGCGMAIDLNLEEDLQASYICGLTGAKIRISIGSRPQNGFFNVEIHTPVNSEDLKQTYQQFTRQLHRIFFHGRGEYPSSLTSY